MRDPRKLYRLARQRDLDVTQAMAFEALKADVGRQVQAPRPRALGKSAAEAAGRPHRLQPEHAGKTKYGLVVMDVFAREAAVELLRRDGGPRHQARRKGADGGARRELCGHDGPGQRVRWTGSCLRNPCTGRSGNAIAVVDHEGGVARKGGQWSDHFERARYILHAKPLNLHSPRGSLLYVLYVLYFGKPLN